MPRPSRWDNQTSSSFHPAQGLAPLQLDVRHFSPANKPFAWKAAVSNGSFPVNVGEARSRVVIKMWGAGGSSEEGKACGGGGGFVSVTLLIPANVAPFEVGILVGGGGSSVASNAGAGGGMSAVQLGTDTTLVQKNMIAVAGGGGGGGADTYYSGGHGGGEIAGQVRGCT